MPHPAAVPGSFGSRRRYADAQATRWERGHLALVEGWKPSFPGGLHAHELARYGTRPPVLLCACVQVIATPFYAAVLLSPNPKAALLWLIIPACVGVMQGPVLFATIQGVAEVRTRAVASAIMILIINLIAGIIGPQSVGVISDFLAGSLGDDALGMALLMIATVCSLGAAGFFYLASNSVERDLFHARDTLARLEA